MSVAREAPELLPDEPHDDRLENYLSIAVEMRESDEKILKSHGLNWRSFKALEDEVKHLIPEGGQRFGKYTVTLEEKEIYKTKPEHREKIGTSQRIGIHS